MNVIALYANGSTVLAGTGSGLYRSIDNGANWTVATGATTGAYTSFLASGTAIFTGKAGQGVYKSTDSGASWVAVINGLFHFDITCFAGIGSLIMAGSNGGIYTTSDGGANIFDVNIVIAIIAYALLSYLLISLVRFIFYNRV